jgi:hypothetical protein
MSKATRSMDAADFNSPPSFGGRILGNKVPFDVQPSDQTVQHVGAPPTVQHVGPSTTTSRAETRPLTTTTAPVEPPPEPDAGPP